MALTSTIVSVGATSTLLHTSAGLGEEVHLKAQSNALLYIGPSGVTPATGYPVRGEFRLTTIGTEAIHGVIDAGTVPVNVLVSA